MECRQKAIGELKNKPVWRQHFQAHGKLAGDEKNTMDSFLGWAKDKSVSFNKPLYKLLLIINPILAFSTIFLISMGLCGIWFFCAVFIGSICYCWRKINTINTLHSQLGRKTEILAKYSDLFGMLEKESFTSELLNEQKSILSRGSSTQNTIKKLSGILSAFDYRLNLLVGILSEYFLFMGYFTMHQA